MFDAMRDVVAKDFFLGPAQSRTDRRDLRHHVNAVAVFFNHAGEATHLAFDTL